MKIKNISNQTRKLCHSDILFEPDVIVEIDREIGKELIRQDDFVEVKKEVRNGNIQTRQRPNRI